MHQVSEPESTLVTVQSRWALPAPRIPPANLMIRTLFAMTKIAVTVCTVAACHYRPENHHQHQPARPPGRDVRPERSSVDRPAFA